MFESMETSILRGNYGEFFLEIKHLEKYFQTNIYKYILNHKTSYKVAID